MGIYQSKFKALGAGEMLSRLAIKAPNKTAIVCGDRKFTFREFNNRANRLANGLAALGVSKGDRVAILFKNSNEFLESFFAIARLGAICVRLNFRLTVPEYIYQLG